MLGARKFETETYSFVREDLKFASNNADESLSTAVSNDADAKSLAAPSLHTHRVPL